LVWYAYFFALDFLINILYTVLFASIWILIVSDSDNAPPIGSKTFDSVKSAAGFVDPVHADVTKVHIVATPATNPLKAHTSLIGETGQLNGSNSEGSTLSTMSIAFFWLIKLYFIIIVFSYARSLVVRSHISMASFPSTSTSPWDKLQRRMLSSTYWQEDDEDFKETNRRGN
jgi:inositol phosphorylceramide synthase regulatory subunit